MIVAASGTMKKGATISLNLLERQAIPSLFPPHLLIYYFLRSPCNANFYYLSFSFLFILLNLLGLKDVS
jgi:hypothetical protein